MDIAVALDLSGSMISEDFVVGGQRVNRFNMAKSVLKGFIEKRPSDRIGLIVFATQAFIATPLTLDHDFLQEIWTAWIDRYDRNNNLIDGSHGDRLGLEHGGQPAARF